MIKGRDIDPYIITGRWYKIFIESTGSAIKITNSDIHVEASGNSLKFPEGFQIVDTLYDIHSIPHSGIAQITVDLRGFADGTQGIFMPEASAFDYADIYVFGHY